MKLNLVGSYRVRIRDRESGEVVTEFEGTNLFASEGLHDFLDGDIDLDNLYIGLIDNSGFSAVANGDTMASHAGWSESTDYTEGTRPAWSPDAAATRAKTNSTTVDFTMSGNDTITGLFVTSDNTKGGTAGSLFSAAQFSAGNQTPTASQVLEITYTVSGPA